uniref:Uncharacterized protein n=1 Tax=Candidatus Kentrum sp. FM TaxID=2126340 RepID=A0A450SIF5_9GAMM|nr:MAG: hypothetical protein BECKFM1743C_GA0114222_101198 [Candidatus Kentron sp. FM]VFJ60584.1 MAG: hypothetical protein BECKFM1743A_GA0114220_102678 [Candidatus Kentron sp. FM]VFK13001.1 MAG: hypothetical protein BECKFM1743B_GA0114221_102638 [Candidatus Kentron sp. FM]
MNDRIVNDPIVQEIRRIRDEHARQFNYDLDAIGQDYMARQIQEGSRLVRLHPGNPKPGAVEPGNNDRKLST